MKKMITVFTILVVMAVFNMGCSKKEEPQEPKKPTSESKKESPEERKEPEKPSHGDGQDHSGHNH